MTEKETLNLELDELFRVKQMVEDELFQKYFARPMYEALDAMKPAYSCETLKELATLKGKRQGIELFTDILKNLPMEIRNKKHEADNA